MTQLVFGADSQVAEWAAAHLGTSFGECAAIGICGEDGALIAGVVYNHLHCNPKTGRPAMIEMSIASDSPKWCSRENLDALFGYPFRQLKVSRVQATVHRKNRHARRFVERLGFVYEGMGRRAWPTGGDAAVYSMLPHECRWLRNG